MRHLVDDLTHLSLNESGDSIFWSTLYFVEFLV